MFSFNCCACVGLYAIIVVTSGFQHNYEFIGCYMDGGVDQRLFQGIQANFHETLTPNQCIDYCFDNGFPYAGTEYSYECFCSKTEPPGDKKKEESECNFKCDGDQTKMCGGSKRLSVYSTGIGEVTSRGNAESDSEENYIGCYRDNKNHRSLNGYVEHLIFDLTPELCTALCFSLGYLFAGTQHGRECHCGNDSQNPNDKVTESECFEPCSGDSTKKCGGDLRKSVRKTGLPDVPAQLKYLGCFKDNEDRIFRGHERIFTNINTQRKCFNFCWKLGFTYAGVEYGNECKCDNNLPRDELVVSDIECNMLCSGEPLETCGAGWRLAVYTTEVDEEILSSNATTTKPTAPTSIQTSIEVISSSTLSSITSHQSSEEFATSSDIESSTIMISAVNSTADILGTILKNNQQPQEISNTSKVEDNTTVRFVIICILSIVMFLSITINVYMFAMIRNFKSQLRNCMTEPSELERFSSHINLINVF